MKALKTIAYLTAVFLIGAYIMASKNVGKGRGPTSPTTSSTYGDSANSSKGRGPTSPTTSSTYGDSANSGEGIY